ncbi:hypothetical protein [Rugamonas apoptosis]|uniref:Uncharacterized protein n=1 Tax=Rugamonas apoptosis TaxID=2758570 RepID=A0A7W2IJB7_9BURK|nr:hypothetical protein [Rugamonas apoptosis]MBA5686086.1 hypothetical protein [Rugamonas apoptosis]
MNDAQFDRLHDQIDAHAKEVERFHDEVTVLSRQVANCDRLVKLANASLGQIDEKIAEAVQVGAQAQLSADAASAQASAAATAAVHTAIGELVGTMHDATQAAREAAASLDTRRFKTGAWIAAYAAVTILCCVATAYVTSRALRGNALTPEQAQYIELGKAHEALLGNASDKELKQISAIRNRPPRTK